MLSGLHQSPHVTVDVSSLVNFWHAGVKAYEAQVTYANESRVPIKEVFAVYRAQQPLLQHVFNEVRVFKHSGWKANTALFQREDDLTQQDKWILSRFAHDVLSRDLQVMIAMNHHAFEDKNYTQFNEYARDNFRLFPSLGGVIRGICRKLALRAAEKNINININANVTSVMQFATLGTFGRAKAIFQNLIDNGIKYGRIGGCVDISLDGLILFFEDDGFGMDKDFAEKLGKGICLREGRVKDASGSGIGWRSIGECAADLGWEVAIKTAPDRGTRVRVAMNKGSFASTDEVKQRRREQRQTREIMIRQNLSTADIVRGALQFANAQPFKGYRRTPTGDLDVRDSPIFQAIVSGQKLIEPLEVKADRAGRFARSRYV